MLILNGFQEENIYSIEFIIQTSLPSLIVGLLPLLLDQHILNLVEIISITDAQNLMDQDKFLIKITVKL